MGVRQHVQQQAGGFVPGGAVMQMGAGQRHIGNAANAVVAHSGNHDVLRHLQTVAAAVLQRTQGDGVGRAEQAVQPRRTAKQLLRLVVAGFHVELGSAHPLRLGHETCIPQRTVKAFAPGKADGFVQQGHAQVARLAPPLLQHVGGGGLRRAEIIVEHTAEPGILLPHDYHRHMQALQHRVVFRGKHGGNQDNAVHRIMPQGIQRAHFAGVVVGGVDQQQLVVLVVQYPADALHHAGAAFAAQPRHDHPNLPRAAGAQHLGLHTGAVAGGFHRSGNLGALFGA